jgi:O-acetylhomoserine/O-acetylserine sulfhydrylase-like pyridoxal-dependent enzyme
MARPCATHCCNAAASCGIVVTGGQLKWKHRKRYQALRNQIHNLEASIKGYRFEKPLSTKLFAYHVG